MTPLRSRLMRAVVMALMVLALTANVAAANDGDTNVDVVPYDPGLPGDQTPPPVPPAPSPFTE
ncbi:MAG TPA: hypothetical protein VGR85_13600 [Candidatus Limnocylindria bacterium]|nr:hypothetical protein [Candidatus Limnocylindria bacterium]